MALTLGRLLPYCFVHSCKGSSMTSEPLKEVQALRTRIHGTCATVKLVCEMRELTYRGALLHSEVIERMVRELIWMIADLKAEGAEEEHIATIRSLLDELDAADQLLGQKVHELARIEFGI